MSDSQLHHSRSAAAFIVWRLCHCGYVRVLLEHLAEGFAEDAHAAAVDDADAREAGEEGAVDESFDFAAGLVDGLSDDVDFHGDVGAFVGEGDGDAAGAGGVNGSVGGALGGADNHFGDVVAGNLHFQGAHLDFEMIVVDLRGDFGGASGGFEFDGVSLRDVADELRLGVEDLPGQRRWSGRRWWSRTARGIRGGLRAMRRSASLESFCAAARS